MENVKMTTKETDVMTFQKGILISEANVFSPVAVYAPNDDYQTMSDFFEIQKTQPSNWMTWAGPAGIGQYSLIKQKPTGILARFDAYFRQPTSEEMAIDFQEYGNQVLGPAVKEVAEKDREEYKNHSIFELWGERHYFEGPPRLVKSLFLSRVFSGDCPRDISDLVKEVDSHAETGDMIANQGYQFIHSINGKVMYLPFSKPEDFDQSKLTLFGTMEMDGKRLMFFPKDDRNHPIDYSTTIYK